MGSCARATKNGMTLCHNSPCGELRVVKECLWVMWGHTFTNYNSPRGELWHKVVPFSMISGIFKVNIDGATSDHGGNSSIGIIVRDCTGQTIAANCKLLKACYSVELVEIMALLSGVMLAQELHLPWVILESDALVAIQAINDKSTGSSSGYLIQEILQI